MLECCIVEDLLPLYIDDACSAGTKKAVEEHLDTCARCKKKYGDMTAELACAVQPPEPEKAGLFRKARKNVLGIVLALTVTTVCILLNLGGAWEGGPAAPENFAVTTLYFVFWCVFLRVCRNYAPLAGFACAVSGLTFLSAAVGFAASALGCGGFITAFIGIAASVPFYGLRFFAGWTQLYGIAALLSLGCTVYAAAAVRRLKISCG